MPPTLNPPSKSGNETEEHTVTDIDPVASFQANKVNMQAGGEAYDDDEEDNIDSRTRSGEGAIKLEFDVLASLSIGKWRSNILI